MLCYAMLCYAVGCFLAASFALLPAGLLVAVAVGYRSSASLLQQHGAWCIIRLCTHPFYPVLL
jgi:hypothetical protein